MKRNYLTLLFSFILITAAYAQKSKEPVTIPDLPVDAATGLYSYEKVTEVPGTSKDELYKRALAWANGFYKNPNDVIREKNQAEGKMLIKARYKIFNEPDKKGVATAAGDVMYSFTLNFKDGKYKYEITKINWQQISYYPIEKWKDTNASGFKPAFAYYLQLTDETIKAVLADLSKKMSSPALVESKEW